MKSSLDPADAQQNLALKYVVPHCYAQLCVEWIVSMILMWVRELNRQSITDPQNFNWRFSLAFIQGNEEGKDNQ